MTKNNLFIVFVLLLLSPKSLFAADPEFVINGASNISTSSAILNGELISDGGSAVLSSGFHYGEAGSYNFTVLLDNLNYKFDSTFGVPGFGNQEGVFNQPMGLAINHNNNNVYVIEQNSSSSRVQIFNSNGQFLTQFGEVGGGDGQFYSTSGIDIDLEGNVYVSDLGNNRVQKFNSNGEYLMQFGTFGFGNGEFYNPSGIEVDQEGNIYVVDSGNDRVQKFNSNGEYLMQFGASGFNDGEFNLPWGIAVDSNGDIYVTDYILNRVQKFNSNGEYLMQFGTSGFNDGEFYSPVDVDIDNAGNLVVADSGNGRVQIFNSNGEFLTKFGSYNNDYYNYTPGEFYGVGGVAVDQNGRIYASDIDHNRIQKFSRKFNTTINNLKCSKNYNYRFFIVTNDGTFYSDSMSFNTNSCVGLNRPNVGANVVLSKPFSPESKTLKSKK